MATDKKDREAFGQLVQARRKRKNWGQRDVVEAIAALGGEATTTIASVSKWENGQQTPSTRELAEALDQVLDANGELIAALHYHPGGDYLSRLDALEARLENLENEVRGK